MAARSEVRSRWGLAGRFPARLVMAGLWLAMTGGIASPAGASTPNPTVVAQADGFSAGVKVTLNSATLSYSSPQDVALAHLAREVQVPASPAHPGAGLLPRSEVVGLRSGGDLVEVVVG